MTQAEQIECIKANGGEVAFVSGRLCLRVQNVRTGNGWTARISDDDTADTIAEKASDAKKQVGLLAKRTRAAIKAERENT